MEAEGPINTGWLLVRDITELLSPILSIWGFYIGLLVLVVVEAFF